jgi:hypothetical protein
MKRFCSVLSAIVAGAMWFNGPALAASGAAFSPASAGDATFLIHHGNSIFNNDTANQHSAVAGGGAVTGGQVLTFTVWVKGNGGTLVCALDATNLATGVIAANPSGQTTAVGFTTFSYTLDLTTFSGKNFSLSHWCIIPPSNANGPAEIIHVTSYGN